MDLQQLPLADTKNRLSEIVNDVEHEHASYVITKHGKPAAVLVSYDEWTALYETLEVLADTATVRRLAEADAEPRAAKLALTKDEALSVIGKAG